MGLYKITANIWIQKHILFQIIKFVCYYIFTHASADQFQIENSTCQKLLKLNFGPLCVHLNFL